MRCKACDVVLTDEEIQLNHDELTDSYFCAYCNELIYNSIVEDTYMEEEHDNQ